MVIPVQAYKASDGSIHSTHYKAARHDAYLLLMELQVFNHASANAVLDKAKSLVEILSPLTEEEATDA
jgi:hypothetical protein